MHTDKRPAVFLDRDGVLNEEKSYICSIQDLLIFPYVKECINRIKQKGYYAIVITNQSGVARGFYTEEELKEMNRYLIQQTGVDAVYYCPHHPDGTVIQYRKSCDCRKPEIGLLKQADLDYHIDTEHSYMIGDRAGDILTGQRMGIKTVLLESGYGLEGLEEKVSPDYIFKDLCEAVHMLF